MKQLVRKYFLVGALLIGATTQAATVGLTPITGGFNNTSKMVNDSVLNVTWADILPSKYLDWPSAYAWVDGLNAGFYGGHNDWRLATDNGSGNLYWSGPFNPSDCHANSPDELGCLFYNELGATAGSPVTNYDPFTKISAATVFWSDTTPNGPNGSSTFVFYTLNATQDVRLNCCQAYYAMPLAVRTGLTEVAPVPVPATAWLLLSGLGGLGLMSRKRKTLDK